MDPMQELHKQASLQLQVQSQDNGMNSQNETCYCDPHTVKDSLEETSVPQNQLSENVC